MFSGPQEQCCISKQASTCPALARTASGKRGDPSRLGSFWGQVLIPSKRRGVFFTCSFQNDSRGILYPSSRASAQSRVHDKMGVSLLAGSHSSSWAAKAITLASPVSPRQPRTLRSQKGCFLSKFNKLLPHHRPFSSMPVVNALRGVQQCSR